MEKRAKTDPSPPSAKAAAGFGMTGVGQASRQSGTEGRSLPALSAARLSLGVGGPTLPPLIPLLSLPSPLPISTRHIPLVEFFITPPISMTFDFLLVTHRPISAPRRLSASRNWNPARPDSNRARARRKATPSDRYTFEGVLQHETKRAPSRRPVRDAKVASAALRMTGKRAGILLTPMLHTEAFLLLGGREAGICFPRLVGATEQAMRIRGKIIFWGALIAAGCVCVGWSEHVRAAAERQIAEQARLARDEARWSQTLVAFTERTVPARVPFDAVLEEFGIDRATAARAAASAERVFDMRHLRAGNRIAVGRSTMGELRAVRYRIDADRLLWIKPDGKDFHSEIQVIPSKTEIAGVGGEIEGSLFESVKDAGETPELAMRLAEIFGYDLDFYTDPRPGDTFRVVVEKKKLATGEFAAYGRILAAEYVNGRRPYCAVLFHDAAGRPAYYTPEGKSMKKAFLHSPLKFAAPISSHFSMHRYHPILKEYRAHPGIDYAAPTGTPVQSIGDGRVTFAGWKGGAGNLIEIEHRNGYTTYYMHLSRVLVRPGQHVEQGQRIGLVGMTGLATGPHLDFRIQRRGQFLNFERLPLPTDEPVSKRDWKEFAAARDGALAQMPQDVAPLASVAKNAARGD
jgi:murein DD-endopeptidase MepM/ murein hydrolase activator NlpD